MQNKHNHAKNIIEIKLYIYVIVNEVYHQQNLKAYDSQKQKKQQKQLN